MAESPTLHTVNISENNLREHALETAKALAASRSIHTVILNEHDPETAAVFANHNGQVAADRKDVIKDCFSRNSTIPHEEQLIDLIGDFIGDSIYFEI